MPSTGRDRERPRPALRGGGATGACPGHRALPARSGRRRPRLRAGGPPARAPTRARRALRVPPSRPVTVNGGMVMPAWYDIRGLDLGHNLDAHGIESSSRLIRTLLEREVERGDPLRAHRSGRLFPGGHGPPGRAHASSAWPACSASLAICPYPTACAARGAGEPLHSHLHGPRHRRRHRARHQGRGVAQGPPVGRLHRGVAHIPAHQVDAQEIVDVRGLARERLL